MDKVKKIKFKKKDLNKLYIWVVTGYSESGDNYGPILYKKEPTDEILSELANSWDGTDEKDGPGNYGSFVYLSVEEVEVL